MDKRGRVVVRGIAGVAIIVVALVVVSDLMRSPTALDYDPQLGAHRPGAIVSPAATSGAQAPSLPTPSGLDDSFGLIATDGRTLILRSETSPQPRATINGAYMAASVDGTSIAFWRTGPGGDELVVVTAVHPEQPHVAYTVPAGQQGATIVWANDGTGLLVAVIRVVATPGGGGEPGPGSGLKMSTLLTVDLRASNVVALATLSDGRYYMPVGWDRSAELAAAAESEVTSGGPVAPLMAAYVTFETGSTAGTARLPVSDGVGIGVSGSPEGKYVYGLARGVVRVWPLADYRSGTTFTPSAPTSGKLLWRPGESQIVWLSGARLEAFDVAAKREITIYQGIPAVSGTSQDIALFRYDGSAVLIGPTSISIFGTPVPQLLLLSTNTAVAFDPGGAFGFGPSVRLR